MGLIAKIIDSFTSNSEPSAKVELYKNDNANARIFNPPGVDARPLDGDSCFTEDSGNTEGGKDVLGFIDPNNPPVSDKGEHKSYARDADGNIVASIFLRKDGKIQIDCDGDLVANASGNIELNGSADNAVRFAALKTEFDKLKDDLNSQITTFDSHIHTTTATVGVGAPGVIAPTLTTGTPSTADITPAKVDNVKLP